MSPTFEVMQKWKSNPDLIQVLHHLAQEVAVLSVLAHLCSDHAWRETKQEIERAKHLHLMTWFYACVCAYLGTRNTGWRKWWDPGAKSFGPSCKTRSSHRSPPAHTSQSSISTYFDKPQLCLHSRTYLHGAPAHSDHLEQGDGLHVPLSAVAASWSLAAARCGLGLFALDVLCAFMDPLPSPLGGSTTWGKDYYTGV